jgi:hypothetical protein
MREIFWMLRCHFEQKWVVRSLIMYRQLSLKIMVVVLSRLRCRFASTLQPRSHLLCSLLVFVRTTLQHCYLVLRFILWNTFIERDCTSRREIKCSSDYQCFVTYIVVLEGKASFWRLEKVPITNSACSLKVVLTLCVGNLSYLDTAQCLITNFSFVGFRRWSTKEISLFLKSLPLYLNSPVLLQWWFLWRMNCCIQTLIFMM